MRLRIAVLLFGWGLLLGQQTPPVTPPAPVPAPEPPAPEPGPEPGGAPEPEPANFGFVKAVGTRLMVGERAYPISGSNNYFVGYSEPEVVDGLLEGLVANGMNTLRVWGAFDIGEQSGANSIAGKANGVYYHYWDGAAPAFNDGPDGLAKLDYVVAKAGELGVRLIIPFVNNWQDFGGMDQYVRWAGGQYHDDFYTNAVIRQWYKDWIAHLLTHVNSITGVAYKDDPTILMWELANEPRCKGSGKYPQSKTCTAATLVEWATDVSAYVKSLDENHLVATGDEGFFCVEGSRDWLEGCGEGVDNVALAGIPTIDVLSFHMYPVAWGKDRAWGTEWVRRHIEKAQELQKPALLGEFGWEDGNARISVYQEWTEQVAASGGNGALFWMLSTRSDYGGYDVKCPEAVCTLMRNLGRRLELGNEQAFAPVAGERRAEVESGKTVELKMGANVAVYAGAGLDVGALDLEPEVEGVQSTRTVAGGVFEAVGEGVVRFTPEAGFEGKALGSYTVADTNGAVSEAAPVVVTVKPAEGAPYTLFSFETGLEGWGPASWLTAAAGTAEVSEEWAAQGTKSLKIVSGSGGWFGVSLSPELDLRGRTKVTFDVKTGERYWDFYVALQAGSSYQWCQQSDGRVAAASTATKGLTVAALGCANPDLAHVKTLFVLLPAGGTYFVDRVRVE